MASASPLRDITIAFIGAGKMAEALLRGVLAAGVPAARLAAFDPDRKRLADIARELGCRAAGSNEQVVEGADLVVLAVKPAVAATALEEARPGLRAGATVVSIAAGVPLSTLAVVVPAGVGLVRAMPNTPCQVGQGMTALAADSPAPAEGLDRAEALFAACGRTLRLPERLFDAVTGLSGSGPAYIFLVIEAMADGGVQAGLPRAAAQELAAQTVLGAAAMVLGTGSHPGQLKDMVASPAGTTIAGLAALETRGLRAALMEAVRAAAQRSAELG